MLTKQSLLNIMFGMKIVVVGVGKVGKTLASNFINELHDVTVIDVDRQELEGVVNHYDLQGVVGSGLERETLENANVSETDLFIACTSRDEMNVLTCMLAKKMGAKCTVARVREPEIYSEVQNLRQDLGVDLLFNPDRTTAEEIYRNLKYPSAKNVEVFAGGRALMVEFEIEKGNPIIDKDLMTISRETGVTVLFAVVKRGDKAFIPHGDFIIHQGDDVMIIGSEKDITDLSKKLKIFKPSSKSAVLIGGSKISYMLAEMLIEDGVSVKIIEKNKDTCYKLAELLPDATIILGDGIDQSLLEEESIGKTDAMVTLTEQDESNVMISLYALQKQIDKVITKVNRTSTIEMASNIGLDSVVSPRNAVANQIIGYVRAHQSKASKGLVTLYKLAPNVDAIEFVIDDEFKYAQIPLKKLKVRSGSLIAGIVREGQFILPSGYTTIQPADRVIVVTSIKQVTELTEIFR